MAGRVDLEAGTRRKRRPKGCPNPLFVKWVEEWRDEAREKGIKSQYSYTKVRCCVPSRERVVVTSVMSR